MTNSPANAEVETCGLHLFWRFGLVLVFEFALLFYLPELGKWSSISREVWQRFAIASVSAICLVVLVPVLIRGSSVDRLWATLLCCFPGYLLFGCVMDHIAAGG
jgi:hypothetical protein